ncbi:MAG: glycoside hydrolase family 3 N-terminal domain-containing protein [Saprospiraceae bacterium]
MRIFSAVAKTSFILLLAACTPKQTQVITQTEAINGVASTIIEKPVMGSNADFGGSSFSESGPVNIGAFKTTVAQEAKIDSLISVMTVEEKAGQMNQYTSFYDITGPAPTGGSSEQRFNQVKAGLVGSMLNVTGVEQTRKIQELAMQSRLKIPMIFGFDVIHGFKTQFPVPLAEAATFDIDMIQQAARWAAIEASAYGIHWTFAPMVDVSPDARWGRIVEGAGEDPYYGSMVAAARVRGFQGARLSDETSIAACAKHFAGYGYAAGGRDYNSSEVSDYVLNNEILPPFKAAAEAGSATFMNGFHSINGQPVTGSKTLQRDWLKDGMKWPGFIVSDWGSIGEMIAHGSVADNAGAAKKAVEAGSDMDMETRAYIEELPKLVKANEVDVKLLDDAVRRILRVKMALGLFENPYKNCDPVREAAAMGNAEMKADAIEMAAASAVLLKNEGNLLPLKPTGTQKIVVIGDLASAKDSPQGTWSLGANRGSAVTLVDAIEAQLNDVSRMNVVTGPSTLTKDSKQDFLWEVFPNTTDRTGMNEAVAAARAADVVIMALGEPGFMSGEARSRTDIGLPGLQQDMFDAVHAVNKNIAVILYSGRPLAIESLSENAQSILLAWQPGTYGNQGIAELIFGKANPRGKLPVSFPYVVGQEPLTYREYSTGRPGYRGRPDGTKMVFSSHYMDAPVGALFPFGHGLSYTTFKYKKPTGGRFDSDATRTKQTYKITTTVTNTGKVAGTEVVQLYINDPVASRVRPIKELKGVRTVFLEPGASKIVTFLLGEDELLFWSADQGWHVEAGTIKVWIGGSSADLGEGMEIEVVAK